MTAEPRTALVGDVQRFSVHDGPGIRTTIFFKGCSLRCAWCHNPELLRSHNEVAFAARRCIECGTCAAACPTGALLLRKGVPVWDSARCDDCLRCTEVCPSTARHAVATRYKPEDLLRVCVRDRAYYGDDGGITLSGGEPLLQTSFLAAFLPLAKAEGLNVVAQTSGAWAWGAVEPWIDLIDLFLFDIKCVDVDRHRRLTGKTNRRILDNLERLVRIRPVRVRAPIIPGVNMSPEDAPRIARLLEGLGIDRITLVHYHAMGEEKRAQLRSCARGALTIEEDVESSVAAMTRALGAAAIEVDVP